MIMRNCDKNLSTAGISLSRFFCPFSDKCFVRSTLVVNKVDNLWWAPRSIRTIHLCCPNSKDKCRINSRLSCHLGRNGITTICTGVLPLTNPFLKALQAKIMTAWSRNRSIGKVHADRAVQLLVEKIEKVAPSGAGFGVGEGGEICSQELLAAGGFVVVREG